ncbi:MAG TPA: phytoene/squalene synthase family protein [Caldimonas sp.]|nr:phytoene/squalene synthase family protein [Caldimonas sp.]
MLANGSRTFLAASLLLPRAVRDPACALYAFCRVADDAIDTAPEGEVDAALADLRRALDRVYDGAPAGAIERAFAFVVRRHGIPRALPEGLLEGFAWDVAQRRYESMADLHDYAARVAGTVGAMMALVMGARSPAALARACDLGVAMQLSNIARDVGEDARLGRVYLPLAWLRQAGIDVDGLVAAPRHDARLGRVVARVLAHAEALYARVGAGVAELPAGCRIGINAARFLYAEIGHEVGRRGGNSIDSRAVVPTWRKAALLARAVACVMPRRGEIEPPLSATRHLVDAASSARPAVPVAGGRTEGRVVWLLELFERLERQDRLRHAGSVR